MHRGLETKKFGVFHIFTQCGIFMHDLAKKCGKSLANKQVLCNYSQLLINSVPGLFLLNSIVSRSETSHFDSEQLVLG